MKKVILGALAGMIILGTPTIGAQSFLNQLKQKAKEVENTVKKATTLPEKGKSTSKSRKTSNESSNTDDSYMGRLKATSATLSSLPQSTMDQSNKPKFGEWKVTPTTKKVHVEGDMLEFSDFYDGVAYVRCWNQRPFFIDKAGNVLFTTEMDESEQNLMPRFENGVVMEAVGPKSILGSSVCRIRDKKGNIVAELPAAVKAASNFVNGIAAVCFIKDREKRIEEIRYVNTSGKFVMPELWFETASSIPQTTINNVIRAESEGLTAFVSDVLVNKRKERRWGYRDSNGKVVIKPQFVSAGNFKENRAAVSIIRDDDNSREEKWGFIDKTGNMVIRPRYSIMPSPFDSGLSMVMDKEGNGYYIDAQGEIKLGPVSPHGNNTDGNLVYISPFSNGTAVVGFEAVDKDGFSTTFHGTMGTDFVKRNWAQLAAYVDMLRTLTGSRVEYFDGNYYIMQNYGGSDTWIMFDPQTFNRLSEPLSYFYKDGLTSVRYQAKNRGFVDKDGNFVIVFEEEKF